MSAITAFEAKLHFGQLLARVAAGEEVVITRHERPVARIVPEGGRSRDSIKQAVAGLRALRSAVSKRKGHRRLTDSAVRRAVEQGRP